MAVARRSSNPSVAHPFIGRGEVLEALRRALASLRGGNGTSVLVLGDAGVGKSTLVSSITEAARRDGCVVLEGRALPRDLPQPFEPLKEAMRGLTPALLHGSDGGESGLRGIWVPERPSPPSLLPLGFMAWREAGPSPSEKSEEESGPDRIWGTIDRSSGGVEEDRLVLFDRLYQALATVSRRQPVLLVLEDIHLADRPTLEFVQYLTRQSPEHAMGLILTSAPLDTLAPEVRDLLGALEREGHVESHTLRPLNVEEVSDYLRWLNAGAVPEADTVTRLYAESEGNPLFLERLAMGERGRSGRASRTRGGAGQEGSQDEPSTAGGPTSETQDRADEVGRKLLAYGAVLGTEFPFAAIARVSEADEETVARSLERLVRAKVLEERPGEVYAFRTAAQREEVLSSLTETRKRRLHRRLAEVVELLGPDAQGEELWVKELSLHFHLGGQDLRSFEYNCRLFELTRHAGRIGEAREALERALEAIRRLPPEQKAPREQEREVLLRLGEVLAEAGELRRSEERLMEAFTMFLPNEPHEVIQLAIARTHMHQGRILEARRRVRALAPAPHDTSPSSSAVEAAGLLAEAAIAMGELDEGLSWARRALHYAEGLPDHGLLGDSCRRLGEYYLHELDEAERARALFQRALRLFEEEGDDLRRIRLELPLAELEFLRGRTEEGFRRLGTVTQWGEERGAHLLHAQALLRESHHALTTGELERSERSLAKARGLVPPENGPSFEVHYALLDGRHAHRRGDHDRARTHLARAEEIARTGGHTGYLVEVLLARAEAEIARGDLAQARKSLDEAHQLGVPRHDQRVRWTELSHAASPQEGSEERKG